MILLMLGVRIPIAKDQVIAMLATPPSLTPQSLSSSAPVKQAAPSLAPPPLTTPPPPSLEGSGIREQTKSDKPKRKCVLLFPLAGLSARGGWGGGGGGDTDNERTEEGNTPPLPPPPLRGREGRTLALLSHLP